MLCVPLWGYAFSPLPPSHNYRVPGKKMSIRLDSKVLSLYYQNPAQWGCGLSSFWPLRETKNQLSKKTPVITFSAQFAKRLLKRTSTSLIVYTLFKERWTKTLPCQAAHPRMSNIREYICKCWILQCWSYYVKFYSARHQHNTDKTQNRTQL